MNHKPSNAFPKDHLRGESLRISLPDIESL